MHSPKVVVFTIRRPWPQRGPRDFRWRYHPAWIDVWHDEPDGADSGTICKGMRGTGLTWHNLRWAVRHRRHLRIVVVPVRDLRQWLFDRCAECGVRFRRRESRFGYMSSDAVYHHQCMRVRSLSSQLDDAMRYITHTADRDARWRIERKLDREPAYPASTPSDSEETTT